MCQGKKCISIDAKNFFDLLWKKKFSQPLKFSDFFSTFLKIFLSGKFSNPSGKISKKVEIFPHPDRCKMRFWPSLKKIQPLFFFRFFLNFFWKFSARIWKFSSAEKFQKKLRKNRNFLEVGEKNFQRRSKSHFASI